MRSKDPILGDSECIDMVAIHLTSQHTQVKFPCINVQNRAYCQKKSYSRRNWMLKKTIMKFGGWMAMVPSGISKPFGEDQARSSTRAP
jgi:hypothetical protein